MSLPELETPASRVLYINSKDATTRYGQFDTDFDFSLEEPISVPPHHIILLSLYSAEIPYSFYYFDTGHNTRIVIQLTAYGTCASYTAGGFFDETLNQTAVIYIPEGNYNAIQLANTLTNLLGDTVANPLVYPITVTWNPITLKFDFLITTPGGYRMTIGISNVSPLFTPGAIGGNMNEELGFIFNHPIPINDGDLYVGWNGAALWESGYSNGTPGIPGIGLDTPSVGSPFAVATPLVAQNVGDLTASVRSLFLRTNLSTNSVLDSHIGGGFSNILARIPINSESGGTIRVEPVNGAVHKLLIKAKTITNISLRLTNQQNVDVDLNGLHFDASLMMNFIHERDIPDQPDFREIWDEGSIKEETEEVKLVKNPRPDRIPYRPKPEETKKKKKKKDTKK